MDSDINTVSQIQLCNMLRLIFFYNQPDEGSILGRNMWLCNLLY